MNDRLPAPDRGGRPSLRSNFRWTLAGNILNALCQWGMLTLLAKAGSAELVGRFSWAQAVVAPIIAVSMLQLRAVQATDAAGEFTFGHYFGARIVLTALGWIVIVAVGWAFTSPATAVWVVVFFGLAKSIESISEIIRGFYQRHERMDTSAISMTLKGAASLAAMGALFLLTGSLVWGVIGIAIACLATLTAYDVPRARDILRECERDARGAMGLAPSFERTALLRLTKQALPLGLGVFVLSLQTQIPRYFVQAYHSEAALGYFSALAYVMVAGTMVVGALGQSASPRLASYFVNDLDQYVRLFVRLVWVSLALGATLVLLVLFAGSPILTLLYRSDYATYHAEFVVVSLAMAVSFVSSFCGYALTAARVFRVQFLLGVISCVVSLIASSMLVPTWGVRGAAWTTVLTSAAMLACFGTSLRNAIRTRRSRVSFPATDAAARVLG